MFLAPLYALIVIRQNFTEFEEVYRRHSLTKTLSRRHSLELLATGTKNKASLFIFTRELVMKAWDVCFRAAWNTL